MAKRYFKITLIILLLLGNSSGYCGNHKQKKHFIQEGGLSGIRMVWGIGKPYFGGELNSHLSSAINYTVLPDLQFLYKRVLFDLNLFHGWDSYSRDIYFQNEFRADGLLRFESISSSAGYSVIYTKHLFLTPLLGFGAGAYSYCDNNSSSNYINSKGCFFPVSEVKLDIHIGHNVCFLVELNYNYIPFVLGGDGAPKEPSGTLNLMLGMGFAEPK